jgi:polygalacturonase
MSSGIDRRSLRHGGITVGSEMSGGVRNVYARDLTGITLAGWTVDSCQQVWSINGTSATDPVGTVTLDDITVTSAAGQNSAQSVTSLVVKDVTVGGVPQTA